MSADKAGGWPSNVASCCHNTISPKKSNATVSKRLLTCRLRRAKSVCHSSMFCPWIKLNTGITGFAHHDNTVNSSLYLGNTSSRASTTYKAASLANTCRSTFASCAHSFCAAGLSKNCCSRSMPSCCGEVFSSSQSSTPPASSKPGVSCRYSHVSTPSPKAACATWRVVAAAFFTSPKRLSRSNVRINEVLPVLVWPTTASDNVCIIFPKYHSSLIQRFSWRCAAIPTLRPPRPKKQPAPDCLLQNRKIVAKTKRFRKCRLLFPIPKQPAQTKTPLPEQRD